MNMNIRIKSTISITDDDGYEISFDDHENLISKMKQMHEDFKKDIKRAIQDELDPTHGFDYDRAMGVIR